MSIIDRARALRPIIEEAVQSLPDETAVDAVELYPFWTGDGFSYSVGTKVRYADNLYKCLQAHVSQSGWDPASAASLWAKMLNPDPEIIPVWEQPDSTNPYMTGDKVHFPTIDDPVYESLIDNNIWSPAAYPAGWKEVIA